MSENNYSINHNTIDNIKKDLIAEFLEDLNDAATFGRRSKLREKWEAKRDS